MGSYGTKLIFSDSITTGFTGGGESKTAIIQTNGSEYRNAMWAESRRRISLSGVILTDEQKQEIDLFHEYTQGALETFLIRDLTRCKMNLEYLGEGDGAEAEFQLRLHRSLQGREPWTHNILWPDHDYPAQYMFGGTQVWPRGKIVTPDGNAQYDGFVHLYAGSSAATATEIPRTDWTLERENSGIVTLDTALADGVKLYASGFFYTLVRFDQDYMPMQTAGGGQWKISEGGMTEPKGGE
jgi:hypothetical protein